MNKNEYEEILECLQDTVNNEKRRKQLETFEVRNGKLYKKKKNGKVLRVLKEDETDAILFMTHNHETGGHFGVDTTCRCWCRRRMYSPSDSCYMCQYDLINYF